jgi:Mn-dependent DtxR family transcriptional regulator
LTERITAEAPVESWKEFEHNPITHSAAHHLVAIWELLEEYGYARVSDVARLLEITRGSASITLKGLKARGLVTEDDRRFLGLSGEGEKIVRSVIAKKRLLRKFFVEVLRVDEEQADIDTCKIEHLISNRTAERVARFFRYLDSGDRSARAFVEGFERFDRSCAENPSQCPVCDFECLVSELTGDFEHKKKED